MIPIVDIFLERLRQGYRTSDFPEQTPAMPDRFRGRPEFDTSKCKESCRACADACPTQAIDIGAKGNLSVDLGKCIFCTDCKDACPEKAVVHSLDYRLAVRSRGGLSARPEDYVLASALEKKMLGLFGRSLKLRQVSAAGCNGCELDINVLNTVVFDLGRFGIQFVASPRHADGLLVTGPVSENMREALLQTWEAVPEPRMVIATGACAISGGPYFDSPHVHKGVGGILPVDLYIPGCPPHPYTILDGLLRLLGRIEQGR
jgi:Ni,Fe-hydrogenase III small subunit/Pyruvate/2-oxoacid:ferredoxin oxidoreductase delta subunit